MLSKNYLSLRNVACCLIVLCGLLTNSYAQISVSGTAGGTLDGTYATLTGAGTLPNSGGGVFAALNSVAQTGATITVSITADVTTEPATNPLNAGAWTSITITPSGARTISGAVAANLIDLNGADNVTINGLNSGGNSLTIDNSLFNPASTTIRFINDATNNTITNCTIKGACRGTTNGTIFFSTGTSSGNDGNVISNNTIASSTGAFTYFAIYSNGTSAAVDNSNITINNNNIQDYYFDGGGSAAEGGINLTATGNSAWTITNNRMFQTATRLYTTAGTHIIINILGGSGYTINNNIIGFANSSGTGTSNFVGNSVALAGFPSSYTPSGTQNATRLIAINCSFTAGGTVSNIQGNTIGGIALYTSSGATTSNGILCGININSGNANIGTTSGNVIGATTGQGSFYAACSTTGGTVVGIFAASTNTVSIQNNTIGAVDAVGTTASLNGGFTGIDVSGVGVFTISNNNIGNTTADNIRTGYTTTTGVSGGPLSNAGILTSTSSSTGPFVGIRSAATGATLNMNNNTLRGIAVSSTAVSVTGITNTGTITTTINMNSNLLGTAATGFIRYAFANSGSLTGISNSGGSTTSSLSINSNDFQGIVHTTQGSGSHTYINQTATGPATAINSNTFTNLNVNTTGSVTFITNNVTHTASTAHTSNNNSIVTAFNKGGAGGTVQFFISNSTSGSTVTETSTGNNFSNVTVTGATTIAGWQNTDGGSPVTTVTNNTFNNIIGGSSSITVLNVGFSSNGTVTFNTISTVSGSG